MFSLAELNPRKWRADVFIDTQLKAAHFQVAPSYKLRFIETTHQPVPIYSKSEIIILNEDSIDAGKALIEEGLNPVVHNFANDMYAGGGVVGGCNAQEESLWRRTNLCETQFQHFYPLHSHPVEGIYTPQATVFKSKESEGYTMLPTPFQLSFIAVPAIRYPDLTVVGEMNTSDALLFKQKVDFMFQIAASLGHDSVVTGAFGCGAYKCPPAQVAAIFRTVLEKYNGVFKKVVFACYNAGNYEIFKRILGMAPL